MFKNLCNSSEDDRYRSKRVALKRKLKSVVLIRRSSSYLSAAARVLGLQVRIRQSHGCLSLMSVVFCQVEVPASG